MEASKYAYLDGLVGYDVGINYFFFFFFFQSQLEIFIKNNY